MHFVYFAQSHRSRAIKIGCSSNLELRLQTLDGYTAGGIGLLGAIEVYPATKQDAFALETRWHHEFCLANISGEWFRPVERLRQAIKAHRDSSTYIDTMYRRYPLHW
jgi:hypothetical protein